MTTSDRAGSEERLREALRRLASWDEMAGNGDPAEFPALYRQEVAARINTAAAALAATPTQTGAEGPADREALELAKADLSYQWAALQNDILHPGDFGPQLPQLFDVGRRAVEASYARLAALRSGAEVAAAPGLSEAWAAAEAALPEGWRLTEVGWRPDEWHATAEPRPASKSVPNHFFPGGPPGIMWLGKSAKGETAAAALLALAARLTAKP